MNHARPNRPNRPDVPPDGPAFQGRPLPRPHEEVVDQGLQFDLVTNVSRRRLLTMFGLGAGAAVVVASGGVAAARRASAAATATTTAATTAGELVEIPEETNGPYPADGSNGPDILDESGIVRRDITGSFGDATGVADGVPIEFSFTVIDMANGDVPFAGAAVYAWHCDAEGRYSMYSEGAENENYLRGVQVADDDGTVTFRSIFPACYPGRWPHIHFEVYPDLDSIVDHANSIATSQAAFPEADCHAVFDQIELYSASVGNLASLTIDDGIFSSDTIDQQLLLSSGDVEQGFTYSLVVPVDTTTEPADVSMGGGGGFPADGPPGRPTATSTTSG